MRFVVTLFPERTRPTGVSGSPSDYEALPECVLNPARSIVKTVEITPLDRGEPWLHALATVFPNEATWGPLDYEPTVEVGVAGCEARYVRNIQTGREFLVCIL